eukprot:scaffold26737_cov57-Phaeocystis_antarctica.AAC.1
MLGRPATRACKVGWWTVRGGVGKVFGGPGTARGPRVTCTAVPYVPVLQTAYEQRSQLESQLEGSHLCVSGESQSQPPAPNQPSQLQLFWTVLQACSSLRARGSDRVA